MGLDIPKAFVPLAGTPLVVRSLAAVAATPEVGLVVPVVAEDQLERFGALELNGVPNLASAVAGGRERQDSMRAGMAVLPEDVEFVAVHDAARCLVRPADISRVVAEARAYGAAILAQPARDTVKRVRDSAIEETPPRESLWLAQTPQVFRAELLLEGLAKALADGFVATDDAQLVERLGVTVRVVEGAADNVKITTPRDLAAAEAWLLSCGEPAGEPGGGA